ncbi:MAG: hypothetical protein ETSY1_11150 [Candidatus Entotheonella factor]|uniref:Antitoxin n=1 Tax=Entotheonella factor TaxID=1429438 RepID=W4LRV0_ENTF1|nr:MAG: hypothetical protein ETSY1_11150 [Candidatus Entotheonella factor]
MQITLRGLSPELEKYLQQLAAEENISLNKAALKVLAKGAGLTESKKTIIGQDLDHLFGTWEDSEAEAFLESIKSCDQIDEDFWT